MKRRHVVCGLLVFLCLAQLSGAEGGRRLKTYEAGEVTIKAGFIPDKTRVIFGQPLFITFTATNLSEKAYSFGVGGDNRGSVRHNSFRITATDAHGKPVKDPYSYNNFGGYGKDIVLERGQTYSERVFLGHWCAFDRPGVYAIKCQRILRNYGEEPRREAVPVTSRFELTIAPFEARKMHVVIAGLGKRLRDGEQQDLYEASLALAAIADEEVIPFLALSLERGDYQNKLPAIRGLAHFSSDTVADALLIALKDPDHAVRDAGADALRKIGKLEYGLQSLLPDLGHESPSVRAQTAQALGTTKSKEAFDGLLEATHDSEPAVRHAAAIGLGTLGYKEAIQPLKGYLKDEDMGMRVAASKGLLALGEPLQPEWLTPVIRTVSDLNDQSFHQAIGLIRLQGREEAAPALVSCLNFDDPSPRNIRNMFLILAIHFSPGGPQYYYRFCSDPNTDGTPKQIEENRKILAELKKWLQENH